jgi:methyl-accepting chemotaxis protein
MMFFKKLTIKNKLLIILSLFIIIILFFATNVFLKKLAFHNKTKQIGQLVSYSTRIGAVVHELQKERGRSGGYLGSKGQKFTSELESQKKDTDARKKDYDDFLKSFDDNTKKSVWESIQKSQDYLEMLQSKRQDITAQTITSAQAIEYYTSTITSLIDICKEIIKQDSTGLFFKNLIAYINFLEYKENAGIERAVLTNTFSADKFSFIIFQKFINVVSSQKNYLKEFLVMADEQQKLFYRETMRGKDIEEVDRIEKIALTNENMSSFGIDPAYWFSVITNKIDLLKKVEDKIADDIKLSISKIQKNTLRQLVIYLIIASFLIIFLFTLTIIIIRDITKILGCDPLELIDIAKEIENGDLTIHQQKSQHILSNSTGVLASFFNMSKELNKLITSVIKSTKSVMAEAQSMSQRSSKLQILSEQTSLLANTIQNKSGIVQESVSNVSAAMKQMVATIQEISQNTLSAKTAADTVKEEAHQADRVISALALSAGKVSEISKIIGDIASQTNLLALNATIEAARAGESGKGFAVVANEVKELAKLTAASVTEIENMIKDIQTGTESTKKVVQNINASLSHVTDLTNTIAAAVEEQTAAANEIARLMQTTNSEVNEVSKLSSTKILEISKNVQDVSTEEKNATERVESLSNQLNNNISIFKVD